MKRKDKESIIANYRDLLSKHGDTPKGVQWSPEGQSFRFAKLMEIGDLTNCSILEVGCGLGHMYPLLNKKFRGIKYTGVDIVPESIALATRKYPAATFKCHDILKKKLDATFDYAFISGVFNNALPDGDPTEFLMELTEAAFRSVRLGLAFNFISSHVNSRSPEMAYHDPAEVLNFCIRKLSPKVVMHHHYERCDVAVFVYRQEV